MKHIELLGMKVEDKVTRFSGVVASVSFDLYGCIQALVNPGLDKDGKFKEQAWFDILRLIIKGKTPVMERPEYVSGPVARGEKGAAEKPRHTAP